MVAIIVMRIFSMTGLVFSASFFTKDLYLERELIGRKSFLKTIFLIAARFITIIYSIKMINSVKKREKTPAQENKKIISLTITTIILLSVTVREFTKWVSFKEIIPLIKREEVIMIAVILILTPIITKNFPKNYEVLIKATNEVAHIK